MGRKGIDAIEFILPGSTPNESENCLYKGLFSY
jgi:hypothetical protein